MASTIKLKNGTGGAPSSLSGGEVAINRATGIFYFGDGSAVQELHRFNHISASGHITASGTISSSAAIIGDLTAEGSLIVGAEKTLDVRGGAIATSAAQNLAIVQGAAANVDIGTFSLTANTLISDVADGTAPLVVTSTTRVANLQSSTVGSIAGHAPNTATTQATQAAITTAANLTTVGALNAGSITSGFTSIDVGAGAITTTGTVSAEHVLSSDDIVAQGDISASGTMTALSASFNKLTVTDTNIVGQRHILFNSGIYINDNPLLADNGYFGSSLANTPSNWNDPTPSAFDSSAGTFEQVVDITEDEHGSKIFHAPFAVSRIEVLSSWRTAGTGDDEAFWCGIWTGSAGVRIGASSGAHNTVKNIGFVTGAKHVFNNGGDWEGHNNDLDFTFSTPLPAFTQIYYGMGSGEASSIGTKNIRGHITMMVYEA